VGPDRFYVGLSAVQLKLVRAMLEMLSSGPARSPSLLDIERSDAVLVLGEDVTNTAPRMALALRQAVRQQPMEIATEAHIPLWLDHAVREAVQNERGPLFIAAMCATKLDDVATETYRAAPDDLAQLGFAIAHALNNQAPTPAGLPVEQQALAERIAQALKAAKRPLVVSGPGCNSLALVQAAANVAWALCEGGKQPGLSFTAPECNTFGVGLLGGKPLDSAFEAVEGQKVEPAIILENDLYRPERPD
jgi:NADH-quinone oxidoreductase subunit G